MTDWQSCTLGSENTRKRRRKMKIVTNEWRESKRLEECRPWTAPWRTALLPTDMGCTHRGVQPKFWWFALGSPPESEKQTQDSWVNCRYVKQVRGWVNSSDLQLCIWKIAEDMKSHTDVVLSLSVGISHQINDGVKEHVAALCVKFPQQIHINVHCRAIVRPWVCGARVNSLKSKSKERKVNFRGK